MLPNKPTVFRVIVVGLQGEQVAALRSKLPSGTDIRILTPERALRFRGDDSDLIVLTRFIGHKHESHLRRVAACPVLVLRHGAVNAIVRTLEARVALRVV